MPEENGCYKLSPEMIASIEARVGMSIEQIRATPLAELWARAEKANGGPLKLVSMREMGIMPEIGEGRGPIEPGLVVLGPEKSETRAQRLTKALKALLGQDGKP